MKKKQLLEQQVEQDLEQEHALVQAIGWVSEFLSSVLPRSESFLRLPRASALLDVFAHSEAADAFQGIVDIALVINEPAVRPAMVEFYETDSKPLNERLSENELRSLDKRLRRQLEQQLEAVILVKGEAAKQGVSEDQITPALLEELGIPRRANADDPPFAFTDDFVIDANGETMHMSKSGFVVDSGPSRELMSWPDALRHANKRSASGLLWRLPSVNELQGMARCKWRKVATIKGDYYWTATQGPRPTEAVAVHLGNGQAWTCSRKWRMGVWRVRRQPDTE